MERIIDNYTTVLKKYSDFSGRSNRSEYWYFILADSLISIGLVLLSSFIGDKSNILEAVYSLILFLPRIAVTVRRLHDVGKSGWKILISLFPILGIIWLLILMIREGDSKKNQYGPTPKIS